MDSANGSFSGSNASGGAGGVIAGGPVGGAGSGVSGTGGAIVSSGGDVVEGGGEKSGGKMKKWLLLGLGVLVLVALVLGVVNAVKNGGGGGSGESALENAFNKYANYYLIGEAKAEAINTGVQSGDDTYFEESKNTDTLTGEYLQKMRSYYGEFYAKVYSAFSEDEGILNFVNDYKNKLELVTYYYGGAQVTFDQILEAYVSGGADAATALVANALAIYSDIGDIYGMYYYDYAVDRGYQIVKMIELYDGGGCLVEGDIDYGCVSERKIGDVGVTNEIAKDADSMNAMLSNSEKDLFLGIFQLHDVVYSDMEVEDA